MANAGELLSVALEFSPGGHMLNTGGLVRAARGLAPGGHSEKAFAENTANIPKNLLRIWWESQREDIPMSVVADNMARDVIIGKTSAKELWPKHG